MLSLDVTQLAIVASDYKKVSWLFTVVDSAGPTTYYWSTITRSYGGHDYVYKIKPSSSRGITLNSTNPIYGIVSPTDLSFIVENSGNTLTASNFIGGTVTLDLVISDGTNESTICTWKFNIKRCESAYQTLSFTCEDFIQKYLEGDYPNTRLVKDIIPSNDPDIDDGLCVPVPIGECYIPLRSLYIVDQRYYLLGLATGNVYDITKVRSPRSWGAGKSEWDSGSYSFTQSTKTIDTVDWRVFQAIIADSNGDGSADANGLWRQGDSFLDMPVQFTKNNTRYISGDQTGTHDGANNAAILTKTTAAWGVDKLIGAYVVNRTDGSYGKITDNTATTVTATLAGGTDNDWDIGDSYTIGGPASIIKFVLEDMGVPSSDIDDISFGIAEKTFAGWELAFDGVYDHKKPTEQVLAQLLVMCHSTFQITDKIGLHVLSKTSQKTITKADVLRTSGVGLGTFKYSLITQKQSDSGYIEFQVADESQDKFIKKLVPAKASTDNISSKILTIPFVQDTQDVQRIGTLKYQREFTPKANISFVNKGGTLLALQPDDVATINHADYGGNYPVVVKSMTIRHNLSIDFQCVQYSVALDDWTDLSPAVISIGQDDSTVYFNAAGNRVFSVQPYPPYDVGDLWVGGPSGDIKRCSTARTSGAYVAGNWELASEYDATLDQLSGKGVNVCNARYSSFEEAALPPVNYANGTVTQDTGGYFGTNSLKMAATAANHYCYLGANSSDWNIKITPNKKWIVSAYNKCDQVSKDLQIYVRVNGGGDDSVSSTSHGTINTYKRISGVIDLSSDSSTRCQIRLDNDGGNGCNMRWDGIMLEEQFGNLEVPSVYALPSGIISGWDSQADETGINTADNTDHANDTDTDSTFAHNIRGTLDLYYPSDGFQMLRFYDKNDVLRGYLTTNSSDVSDPYCMVNAVNTLWLRAHAYSYFQTTAGAIYIESGTTTPAILYLKGSYISFNDSTVRIDGSDIYPFTNDSVSCGKSSQKWSDVYTVLQHTGDILFSDTHCPICKKRFRKGDSLILTVLEYLKQEDGDEIDCVPMHLECAKRVKNYE